MVNEKNQEQLDDLQQKGVIKIISQSNIELPINHALNLGEDINENKQLAQQLKIAEIPILKTFVKGKETWVHKGYIEKADLVKNL